MRALNVNEIDSLVEALQVFVGARLQEVEVSKKGVALGFWMKGQPLTWLWFENLTWSPLLLPVTQMPVKGIQPLKPLALFMRAHFVDHAITSIERDTQLGRAVVMRFAAPDSQLIFQLWPHGGNVVAKSAARRVGFVRAANETAAPANQYVGESPQRSLADLMQEWLTLDSLKNRGKSKDTSEKPVEDKKAGETKRLLRAIGKVQDEIANKAAQPFREVGEWLVAHQSLKVPIEFRTFIDGKRSLSWNIENSFHRAKEFARKLQATEVRLKDLQMQLERVQSGKWQKQEARPKSGPSRKESAGIKYRKVALAGTLEARIGKSAKDNMNLLRQAKSWDLWLHLRDYPGSHAILYRGRGENVGDETLKRVGIALVDQTFGEKAKGKMGEVFDMIVAECRFVKPIRGDRVGRVSFSNERTLRFRFTP